MQKHGPSFWKFNASLVDDANFVTLINDSVPIWPHEFKAVTDKRLLWDLINYRIRQVSIKYSKEKAFKRRKKISDIEASLKAYEEKCSSCPSPERSKAGWQSWSEVRTAAQDRNRWKAYVEALCATLAPGDK